MIQSIQVVCYYPWLKLGCHLLTPALLFNFVSQVACTIEHDLAGVINTCSREPCTGLYSTTNWQDKVNNVQNWLICEMKLKLCYHRGHAMISLSGMPIV